jgi:hypothetical protein
VNANSLAFIFKHSKSMFLSVTKVLRGAQSDPEGIYGCSQKQVSVVLCM